MPQVIFLHDFMSLRYCSEYTSFYSLWLFFKDN